MLCLHRAQRRVDVRDRCTELLESDKSGASEHVEGILFQINHVRIIEPAANDDLPTNDKAGPVCASCNKTIAVEGVRHRFIGFNDYCLKT